MGYACPVCEDPQADGEHLANHLAFSALLGRADHEAWLDEHAPGWDEATPEELAERLTPHVPEVEFPEVTGTPTDGGPAPGTFDGVDVRPPGQPRPRPGPETRQVLEEARELTRQRRRPPEDGDDPADGDGGEASGTETDDDEKE